jgi:hypothetical protein
MRSCNGCNWNHSIGAGNDDKDRMYFCFHTTEIGEHSFNQICPCYKCLVKIMCDQTCEKIIRVANKYRNGKHP